MDYFRIKVVPKTELKYKAREHRKKDFEKKKEKKKKKTHGTRFLELTVTRHHTRVHLKPCKQAQVWVARASGKATEAATERTRE